jgi:Domain of unknown function (DUF4114)
MSSGRRGAVRWAVAAALALAGTQAHAACTFGNAGGEPSLQGVFNSILGAGAPSAASACLPDGNDAAWSTVGSVTAIDIVIELAGNAASNTFGLYDLAHPDDESRRLTIFEGNDGTSAEATIRLRPMSGGRWRVSVLEFNNPDDVAGWERLDNLTTSAFGFYLGTSAGTLYSQTALNGDDVDHLYAYRGNGAQFTGGPLAGTLFTPQDYILAWEDLFGGGDRDYQDFVVVVQDIRPVPLPPAVWLLASSLIGLAGVARRPA